MCSDVQNTCTQTSVSSVYAHKIDLVMQYKQIENCKLNTLCDTHTQVDKWNDECELNATTVSLYCNNFDRMPRIKCVQNTLPEISHVQCFNSFHFLLFNAVHHERIHFIQLLQTKIMEASFVSSTYNTIALATLQLYAFMNSRANIYGWLQSNATKSKSVFQYIVFGMWKLVCKWQKMVWLLLVLLILVCN